MMMAVIPSGLRRWFVVHFVLDFLLALGLLIVPETMLSIFGLEPVNFVLARLVGAALVAIGGTSLFMRNLDVEAYTVMLILKLLWSGTAILSLVISLLGGATMSISIFLSVFVLFFIVWAYYFNKIKTDS